MGRYQVAKFNHFQTGGGGAGAGACAGACGSFPSNIVDSPGKHLKTTTKHEVGIEDP